MPLDVFDRLLRPLRSRVVTSGYPVTPPNLPPAARGLPELDAARCDGSATCVAVCPTGAIVLSETVWALDAGKCVFCAACALACPRDAIRLGPRIELAVEDPLMLTTRNVWRTDE